MPIDVNAYVANAFIQTCSFIKNCANSFNFRLVPTKLVELKVKLIKKSN